MPSAPFDEPQCLWRTNLPNNCIPPMEGPTQSCQPDALAGGWKSKKMSTFNSRVLWMVLFHYLVWRNRACPHSLCGLYLGIWFWGTHGVMNIV